MKEIKKYELTDEFITIGETKLYRIRALKAFGAEKNGRVRAGELGGYVEKEENLAQDGEAWVFGTAKVYGNARVCDNAWILGDATICDNACVSGRAWVCDNAKVYGNAHVAGNTWLAGDASVFDYAKVYGGAWVCGSAKVYGDARVYGRAKMGDNATVRDSAKVCGDASVYNKSTVEGKAYVCGDAWVHGNACLRGNACVASTNDYLLIGRIGQLPEFVTFFKNKNEEITATCGDLTCSIDELRAKVKEIHGNTKAAQEYQAVIDFAESKVL